MTDHELTKARLKQLKDQLAEWQTPDAVSALVDQINYEMGSTTFLRERGLNFLHEAWIAGQLGNARGATLVRLVRNADHPDFELCIDGNLERFEATEADDPDRRRGDEYLHQAPDIVWETDPGHWQKTMADDDGLNPYESLEWLSRAARRKAIKNYPADYHLVIYLNQDRFTDPVEPFIAKFPSATQPAKAAFRSVWVLWDGRAYRAH